MSEPYHSSDSPLARYALRTATGEVAKRALVVLPVLVWAAIEGGAIVWLLLLVAVVATMSVFRGFTSLLVRNGAEVRVHRTHVIVPTAFGGELQLTIADLEVDVRSRVTGADAHVVEGRKVVVPRTMPISIALVGRQGRRTLSALMFETPHHAARLASDVQRLRQGKTLINHDNPDLGELMGDFQQVFTEFFEQQRARDPEDELLDEELRR